jgi:hypothetical protein
LAERPTDSRFFNINGRSKPFWGKHIKRNPNVIRLVTDYSQCIERSCHDGKSEPIDALPDPAGTIIRSIAHDAVPRFHRFAKVLACPAASTTGTFQLHFCLKNELPSKYQDTFLEIRD